MDNFCNGCTALYDNYPLFDLHFYLLLSLIFLPFFIAFSNLLKEFLKHDHKH